MKKLMMALVAGMAMAAAVHAEPVRSGGRTFELRSALAAAPRAAAVKADPEPCKKDCEEKFAGAQILKFFAKSVEAAKDSKGKVAMVGGDSLRFVSY